MNYTIKHIVSNEILEIKELEYKDIDISQVDLSVLKEQEKERFNGFKSNKRKREFYYTRVLIKDFHVDYEIKYLASGKPIINDGHISISHSGSSIIVGHSKKYIIGIDIEFFNSKIIKIKDKFLSNIEREKLDIDNDKVLTIIWSLKEAIYKMKDRKGLIFREHILVHSIGNNGKVELNLDNISKTFKTGVIDDTKKVITYCYSPI